MVKNSFLTLILCGLVVPSTVVQAMDNDNVFSNPWVYRIVGAVCVGAGVFAVYKIWPLWSKNKNITTNDKSKNQSVSNVRSNNGSVVIKQSSGNSTAKNINTTSIRVNGVLYVSSDPNAQFKQGEDGAMYRNGKKLGVIEPLGKNTWRLMKIPGFSNCFESEDTDLLIANIYYFEQQNMLPDQWKGIEDKVGIEGDENFVEAIKIGVSNSKVFIRFKDEDSGLRTGDKHAINIWVKKRSG
jgi:hypothetical protein